MTNVMYAAKKFDSFLFVCLFFVVVVVVVFLFLFCLMKSLKIFSLNIWDGIERECERQEVLPDCDGLLSDVYSNFFEWK